MEDKEWSLVNYSKGIKRYPELGKVVFAIIEREGYSPIVEILMYKKYAGVLRWVYAGNYKEHCWDEVVKKDVIVKAWRYA